MVNSLQLLWQHLSEIWRHFGKMQRISIVSGLGLAVMIMVGLLVWSAQPDYRLLYSGLSQSDSEQILDRLKEEDISVRLKDGGLTIYVKAKDVYRTRLTLASQGLPTDQSTAGTGFEIFEEPKFGLTDFAQRINYQRALQGELQRTIASMRGIESTRVMLVIPKEGLLATEEERKSTASVLLHLDEGVSLSHKQVDAIVRLVSSSVKNLDASHVTITDQDGQLLTKASSDDPDAPFEQANEQLATKMRVESQLTDKAQQMLDMVLGAGKAIVKVDADMNFDKMERRSESYDKAGRVAKIEQIESESSQTPGGYRGGVTGIRQNVPINKPEAASTDQQMSKMKKEKINNDYLVPTVVQHVTARGGKVNRLSVSVCVAQGAEPRTPAEMDKIRDLVSNAVGFSDTLERKDSIEVVEMAFPGPDSVPTTWWTKYPFVFNNMGKWGVAAIVLIVALLVMRNVLSNLTIREEDTGVEVDQLVGDELSQQTIPVVEEEENVLSPLEEQLQVIARVSRQNPKAVAAWITGIARG